MNIIRSNCDRNLHARMPGLAGTWICGLIGIAGAAEPAYVRQYDLSADRVLYCVGYAHLDTQWRWDFPTTIDKYLRDTLDQNFALFEKYPGYVFNFTGSVRYEMMKEYYPEKYEQLKKHIAAGRWFVSGSSVDEGDVNVPSAEAIIRQVLYGNEFFRREFGKESVDFMLPDCFGFPASLPSIWAHCGLKGFSTQKLTWGSAMGIPFKIGVWEGPDGRSVLAALDPGPYVGAITGRVDLNSEWVNRVMENGSKYGVWADYHYYGVGDQGGAPREEDVRNYLASVDNPDSRIKVALTSSDQMYKDISPEMAARLPRYKGDLLLTEHSAGTLTSQAYMKRWNRKNECLADAAERAAVVAHWLGGASYPREKLNRSWVRVLANQMHDILPGTSIPRAYTYSWNDEIVAMNGFAAVLKDSVGAIARALDTQSKGVSLLVYNPLAHAREDVVEATVRFSGPPPQSVTVYDPQGNITPSQMLSVSDKDARILFAAKAPPVSWSVFDVRPTSDAASALSGLQITPRRLENEHYRIIVNDDGDVASIVDKETDDRELLASPARLVFTHEKPQNWPAWNMDWYDRQKAPRDYVSGPARFKVLENGPVRVALEIERQARNSVIRQRIRLARGDAGRRIEFATEVEWQSTECALKASFPLTVSNPLATYNWGMGTIQRGNNEPTKYEVPSHEWFDLTDVNGQYGVSILEDSKYGSDKPSNHEVRLTLLYTPGVRSSYLDQHSQDWGRHEMLYALFGHRGDWRDAGTEWHARRLNQPLHVWQVEPHTGPLGRSFSFLSLNDSAVDLRALKPAENSDQIIIRLQELEGRQCGELKVVAATKLVAAQEIDGQERSIREALLDNGHLRTTLSPYSAKSFAIRLKPPDVRLEPPRGAVLPLPFDTDVVTTDADRSDGAFDADRRSIPAETLPARLLSEGIEFQLGPTGRGELNALSCRGQTLDWSTGDFNKVYLLAAADEDVTGRFQIQERVEELTVHSWTGFVGQWDDRVWDREFAEVDHVCDGQVTGIRPGFIKRDPIAWFSTHRHHAERGNEAYKFSYLFRYGMDLRPGEHTLRLPDDPRIKILAMTVAKNDNEGVREAAPLYDDFTGRAPIELRHVYPPPHKPAHEGVTPLAAAKMERASAFESLQLCKPSASDYADRTSNRGAKFRFFDENGDYRPHARAGAEGDVFPRLNDGQVAASDDDTKRCVWYDNEGRFFIDLQRSIVIRTINTYSRHRSNRARQFFSLWGANGETMPHPGFQNAQHGEWALLAVVDSGPLGEGGVHASMVHAVPGQESIGPYRYLLWIAENIGQGTFFTEIDVHAAE